MGKAEGQAFAKERREVSAYLLDTHVWLWSVTSDTNRVSAGFFKEIEAWQRAGTAYLSPFSCWEIGLLISKGQLRLDLSVDDL
jgi:PIN domain nuclease of toxin-antitoxin system